MITPAAIRAWSFDAKDNTTAFNAFFGAVIAGTSDIYTDAEARAMMDRRSAEHIPGLTGDELYVLLDATRERTRLLQKRPLSGRSQAARENRRQLRGWGHGHAALLREALRRGMKVPHSLI